MARVPWQPGLFEADSPPPVTGSRPRALRMETIAASHCAQRLWLCLYLPDLPLAALPSDGKKPRAVLGEGDRRARVQFCDEGASYHGIRPGLPATAALALLPELQLLPRDPRCEQRLLEQLAGVAMEFTPCVSISAPAALLLEVGGSLKLFGGADRLRELILQLFCERGHVVRTGIAPTARAAYWLAHAGNQALIRNRASLAGGLADLPVAGLPWPGARRRALQEMGVDTLSDCVRLPRDGLTRRLGAVLLRELDQAYGRCPEVLDWHRPGHQFDSRVELEQESRDVRQLAGALDVLLERLAEQMRLLQKGVRRIWLRCEHQGQSATRIRIGLLRATADPARLRELGRVQLGATTLPAAVIAVGLQAALNEVPSPLPGDLLERDVRAEEDALAFIERLRARLGERSVHGLQTRAEHRPEYAWQAVHEPAAAGGAGSAAIVPAGQRPLWMLSVPPRLQEVQGRPVFQGDLQLAHGPERIETGWWDGVDIRRDYYVAWNQHGMRLWIYRDLREGRWYLHGIFG
jgi:protein ImuB